MNKTAIKNFAIWARNKLIADIQYRAGLMGITAEGIKAALPQSTTAMEFYDIGTAEPYSIAGDAIRQRKRLVEIISRKEKDSDYPTAYKYILEEVAYTWFNRLIAIRFMEVNDYLPSHIRVLSSESGKVEPDLVTTPFDAELTFSPAEEETILRLKTENQVDELFRLLFIKQCNALNEILPALFEKTSDYTELLLNLSVVDREGVVYHLVHDIDEDDFNIEKGGQVEIIGWLYQYYNTEPKNAAFAQKGKITREEIPAVTQLFTPDWIVRYMVENSLGRLWIERNMTQTDHDIGHWEDNNLLRTKWKYYLDEAEQEPEVKAHLETIRGHRRELNPQDIKFLDPCMGSGHILVYAFEVLMQIYESQGWSQRDAAQSIMEHNLYGLDIDDRAAQLAYFAVMMKARQYDRRILARGITPHIHSIAESNAIGGAYKLAMGDFLLSKEHQETLNYLLEVFYDAKEYGSILQLECRDYAGLLEAWKLTASQTAENLNITLWYAAVEHEIPKFIEQAIILTQKYDVVVTNPPYMGGSNMDGKLSEFVKKNYPDTKSDMSTVMMERTLQMCKHDSFMSMINIPVWMFLSSYEKLREHLILENTIINMVHPGRGIFGSDFGTTSFVIGKNYIQGYKGTYFRLFDKQGEVQSIEEREHAFLSGKGRYTAQQSNFSKIPGAPVAYWVSEVVYNLFENKNSMNNYGVALQGTITGDNDRFLRIWYEVSVEKSCFHAQTFDDSSIKWYPHSKGGEKRKWYGNNDYLINWHNNGYDILHFFDSNGKLRSRPQNISYFLRRGISWSDLTSGSFGARFVPDGSTFNVTGPTFYPQNDEWILPLIAYMNSPVFQVMLNICCPGLHYHNGVINNLPILDCIFHNDRIANLAEKNIHFSHDDWDSYETSWDFKRHPLVELRHSVSKVNCPDSWYLKDAFDAWEYQCRLRFDSLKANEEELNRIFIDIYGLQDELTPEVADKDVTVHRIFHTRDDVPESMKGSNYVRTLRDEIVSLLSYAVGCMFGRYSIYRGGLIYAGGDFEDQFELHQTTLDDFEQIGWDGVQGKTFAQLEKPYYCLKGQEVSPALGVRVDVDNILPITDEEYLENDIISRLCDWLKAVYGADTLEENLDFIAKALGNKGDSSREIIRSYFLKDFFKDHCKTYQKRPIYWLFDSGRQNGFKALIYLHRYTPDTIGSLRVDYLHKIQRVYESEINRMQDMIDNSKNPREVAASTKRKEKLQKQLKECRDYDEMIAHLALSRIELDLDDGVKINYEKVQTASDGKKYPVLAKI